MNLTQKELRLIMQKPPGQLTAEDLRWLDPRHIPSLSPRHVASLTTSELLGMNPKQLGALTQEQVAVMTLEQMGLVPASVKRRRHRLAVNLARVEQDSTAARDHVLMLWQMWLFLFFVLLIPILKTLHAINLI